MTALQTPLDDHAACPPSFEVRVRPHREVVHLEPVGELDIATTGQLRDALEELVAAGFSDVVVDLRELEFIDRAGLRLLLAFSAAARREGWRLSLIQGTEAVQRLFAVTDTLDLLPFSSPTTLAERRR